MFNNRNNLSFALILSLMISLILLMVRVLYHGNFSYLFLAWNLFLAFVPLAIVKFIRIPHSSSGKRRRKWIVLPMLAIWLLFFPNAPYIVTDMVHLGGKSSHHFWYDLFLIYWFAFAGIIAGMISLYRVQQLIEFHFGRYWARTTVVLSSVLAGYGVYLGRVLRWNSWDVFTNPLMLLHELSETIHDTTAQVMTFAFGLSLIGIYTIFTSLLHYQPQRISPE